MTYPKVADNHEIRGKVRRRLFSGHRDVDALAHALAVRAMCAVGELHGEPVAAGLQEDLALGLALAEVLVLIVVRDDDAGIDIAGIDQQMMMAGAFGHIAGWCDAHAGPLIQQRRDMMRVIPVKFIDTPREA